MAILKNFLPEQYLRDSEIEINHNYLAYQFSDHDEIWEKIREVVLRGDFTLGKDVDNLEVEFAGFVESKYAVGVGSGTDALFLSLKAVGVGEGDEVITSPFTFYATVGAIVTAGAKPIFCDIESHYNLNPNLLESKISPRTKAIMPIHWSGRPCEIEAISSIAKKYNIPVIYDACHAIGARYNGSGIGEMGLASCYSFHPLKNLNVWGDGGIIATSSLEFANKIKLMRNHGLSGRDRCEIFAYNSRLDSIQAVVARHMLKKIHQITSARIKNAKFYDELLKRIPQVTVPTRDNSIEEVFHLYSVLCEKRDELQKFLIKNGVDAKVHYPVPMHLQPAADKYGYEKGDFPVAEMVSMKTISFPVHEFIEERQQLKVLKLLKNFYG
jgi:dTDP-4-amino-4,6-dideoxygalactose transaminase